MYYVCVENKRVANILNYKPNAPESVKVIEITTEEHALMVEGTHLFDCEKEKVVQLSGDLLERRQKILKMRSGRSFLQETDWKVLRHIREKALGMETTMTEEEYIALEMERHEVAKKL
jgi:hypothetical protein